jgi:hypothetical protein
MSQWPADNPRARAAFYGDPAKGECARQLVWVKPPFQMYYDGKPINAKGFQFHRKAAPALLAVFNDIWEQCDRDQAKVDKAGVSDFNGSYNHRKIRGRENERDAWSNHAYGAAIDINAKANGLGVVNGAMPAFVVEAFENAGAKWGGRYKGRKDPMHFEFVDNGLNRPLGFVDAGDVQDNGVDGEDETAAPDHDDTPKRSFWQKAKNWFLGGGLGSLGVGGSLFSGVEPLTVGIIVGAAVFVFLVVWFTRK